MPKKDKKSKKKDSDAKKVYEKPLHLDMSFEEAIRKIATTSVKKRKTDSN